MKKKKKRSLIQKIAATPHLFAKATVIYCIFFASGASVYSLYMQAHDHDAASLLAVILGFFGGELLLLCLKTILKKEVKDDESASDEQGI